MFVSFLLSHTKHGLMFSCVHLFLSSTHPERSQLFPSLVLLEPLYGWASTSCLLRMVTHEEDWINYPIKLNTQLSRTEDLMQSVNFLSLFIYFVQIGIKCIYLKWSGMQFECNLIIIGLNKTTIEFVYILPKVHRDDFCCEYKQNIIEFTFLHANIFNLSFEFNKQTYSLQELNFSQPFISNQKKKKKIHFIFITSPQMPTVSRMSFLQ